jgi:hypothetical protein
MLTLLYLDYFIIFNQYVFFTSLLDWIVYRKADKKVQYNIVLQIIHIP